MGWWRGAERRREGPALPLGPAGRKPRGAVMRKWALRTQTLSGGPGLRHLSAQSASGTVQAWFTL